MITKELNTSNTYENSGKDMRGKLMKREIIFGIIILLISTSIIPGLSGNTSDTVKEKNIDTLPLQIPEKTTSISLYVFGKTGLETHKVAVSSQDATTIYSQFQDLKKELTDHPFNEKTQQLKQDFITLLAKNKILPADIPSDQYNNLLNPPWFQKLRKNHNNISYASTPKQLTGGIQVAVFCGITGEGIGILFPFIMLPRPRIITTWAGLDGQTTAGSFLLLGGFVAQGLQLGTALGFWGIGLAFAFPYGTIYGFLGYALFAAVIAQNINIYH